MIATLYNNKFFNGVGEEIKLDVGDILQVRKLEDNSFIHFEHSKTAESVVENVGKVEQSSPTKE